MKFSSARLRGHRNGQGLSQAEVAQLAGLQLADYQGIEDGVTDPDVRMITALAKALDVAPADLQRIASYGTDYVNAVFAHAAPLPPEDVARAAEVLAGRWTG